MKLPQTSLLTMAMAITGCGPAQQPTAPANAPSDARAAIAERVAAPASVANLVELARVLEQLGPAAIPAIPPTILHPGESLDAPRALVMLQFWIDQDAKAAAEWISKASPLGYRSLAMIPAVERIAESDPQAAVPFVGGSGSADQRLLKPLVRGWVRSGQPGVEDWIRNLGYGFKRQKALGAYFRARIEKDGAPAAIAWLVERAKNEDGLYEEAFSRFTSELTYADPKAGTEWYEKHRSGPMGKGLMMSVIDAWVAVDGPAAMRWVSQQPEGEERDHAVLDGVRWWGIADVQGLKKWGRELGVGELGPWFQPGLPIFARLYGADEPLEGIRWAEAITDEPTRVLTLTQIARQWRSTDATAADAWLAQSPLSEEDRERARTPRARLGPLPAAAAPDALSPAE
jgi:hypothetical protein